LAAGRRIFLAYVVYFAALGARSRASGSPRVRRWRDGARGAASDIARRNRPGAVLREHRAATIFGSVVGGRIAGAVGIPGMFAVSALIGMIGRVVLGYAVVGTNARVGPPPVRLQSGTNIDTAV